MQLQSNVCVIGNGAIGKAAALGLAQAGLSVTLLTPPSAISKETIAQPMAWDARVYALNRVARDFLSSVKVWGALDASRIAAIEAMEVKGGDAQRAGNLRFDAYSARTDALAWIVEDRNLNLALDTALRFAANVRVLSGRATQLSTTSDGATVQLENTDVLAAELIVGADGGQSWVRGQCDIGIDYRPYGQRAIVTNFECDKPHHGVAYQWFTSSEGIVALLPLPGNRMSLVWSAPEALAETLLSQSVARLAERVSQIAGDFGNLRPLDPPVVKDFPLALIRPHAITGPRVALVGDAAHVIHPLAGHGMNLGFADIAMLLKVLKEREPYRDCGDARVLGRYARARKEDILAMQLATDGLERLFSSDFEPLKVARNIGLNLVNSLPGIKRRLMLHAFGKN
jgi:2-octaprenylphenol hydroxylase